MKNEANKKNHICVFKYENSFDPMEYSALYSRARFEKLAVITNADAKSQSAAAELALIYASELAKMHGEEFFNSVPLEYGFLKSGQPYAKNCHISLSHTDGAAAAAVSGAAVGVDVEKYRKLNAGIVKRILSEREKNSFEGEEIPNDALIEIWSAKESYLKMLGKGLAFSMKKATYDRTRGIIEHEDSTIKGFVKQIRFRLKNTDDETAVLSVCCEKDTETETAFVDGETELVRLLRSDANGLISGGDFFTRI